jgi:hypothetical protein
MIEIKTLNRTLDVGDLQLSTEPAQINKILADHPAKFCEVTQLLIETKCKLVEKESELERFSAEIYIESRKESQSKLTEKHIENLILLNPVVQGLLKDISTIRHDELTLGAIKEAYIHRKDCLMQIANNLRSEFVNSGQLKV